MRLSEKVAVITGGASGIGRATALALAARGADVVIADINETRLAEARAALLVHGRRVLAVRCDVTRDADVQDLADQTLAEMGRADLLMNNAGVIVRGAIEAIETTDWQWAFDINVFGVIRGVRAFLPHMLTRGSGYIVNTGSVAGLLALTGEGAPYIASKFAVVGLTEALALYARPRGIGVSLLCPAGVDTNLLETERAIGFATPEQAAREHAAARALGGNLVMSPEEVAKRVVEGIERQEFLIMPDTFHQPLIERRAREMNRYMRWRFDEMERSAER
jgi:NAD(P)-dependent dehydrogenase (short-subunit alcohol dehydrogenase family)